MASARSFAIHAACVMALAACASKPPKPPEPPPDAKVVISAGANINPDPSGQPTPVEVRVYTLRGKDEFSGADYDAMDDKDRETLGASLIGREGEPIYPGQQLQAKLPVTPDTRFVGAMARFRDARSTNQWRAITNVEPPPKKSKKPVQRLVTVKLDKDQISVTVSN